VKINEEIISYYSSGEEINRLNSGTSQLEKARTQEIILPYLTKMPSKILDVGGAAGAYSFWLGQMGHQVCLVDPVPLHIEEAKKYSKKANIQLASINIGEARELEFEDNYFDVVLLLGPLYHLTRREDRLEALLEAKRVVRPGGQIFCAVISRFASTLDGFFRGMTADPAYVEGMKLNLENGQNRNEEEKPGNFTTAYFHKAAELNEEVSEAGLYLERMVAIECFGWLLPYFDHKWKLKEYRELLLSVIKLIECDNSLLGMSAHNLAVVRKIEPDYLGAGI
jgi:ubiquinone/menaquinone biosynthesis C-methylase UbiE